MSASFEEKSVWIQLVAMLLALGGYFIVAGLMLARGINLLAPYVPLFTAAVIVLVAVLTLGHIVAAITGRTDPPDERDRLIGWRAESNASWVVGVGVLLAIVGLILAVDSVWVAHLLLLSLFLSEILKYTLQIHYYRRGF